MRKSVGEKGERGGENADELKTKPNHLFNKYFA